MSNDSIPMTSSVGIRRWVDHARLHPGMRTKLELATTVRLLIDGDLLRDRERFDDVVRTELDAVCRDLEAAARDQRRAWLGEFHG